MGHVHIFDEFERDRDRLADLNRRAINRVDRGTRLSNEIADVANQRVVVEFNDHDVVRREVGIRREERGVGHNK